MTRKENICRGIKLSLRRVDEACRINGKPKSIKWYASNETHIMVKLSFNGRTLTMPHDTRVRVAT